MFERYTEPARRSIFFARYEASFHSTDEITAGLVLVGIMREGVSRAPAVDLLKGRETDIRSALGFPAPSCKPAGDLMRDIPLHRDAKLALAFAAEEAGLDDSFYIEPDHLLRGILRFPNEASDVLQSFLIDLPKAREASRRQGVKAQNSMPRKLSIIESSEAQFRRTRFISSSCLRSSSSARWQQS